MSATLELELRERNHSNLGDNSEIMEEVFETTPCSETEDQEMEVVESLQEDVVSKMKPISETEAEKEIVVAEPYATDALEEETEEEKEIPVAEPSTDALDEETGKKESLVVETNTSDTLVEKVDEKIEKKRTFCYMIRVPRYFDDKLDEQIADVQNNVDEKIRDRDAIRVEVEAQKVTCKEYLDKFEAAKLEVRAAHNALQVKRQEGDSVHVGLNSVKNANTVKEIDSTVRSMQYRMEHETISLKEEKEVLKEIKQLKLQRQQLFSALQESSKKFAVDQKELENNLKVLKKDMDSVRNMVRTNEGKSDAARAKYFAEKDKLRGILEKVRSANVVQQEAYRKLQKLKNDRYNRNKYFRKYKDDATKAEKYRVSGDNEALQSHCVNQVEKAMELWNTNEEFRKHYCRCNVWSSWKRLGASQILGLVQPETKVKDAKSTSAIPSASVEEKPVLPSETEKTDEQSAAIQKESHEKTTLKAETKEEENEKTKEKENEKPSAEHYETTILTEEEEESVEVKEEKTEEEKEKERKETEEAAIAYREQLLLEERIKAQKAEESKKRNAEKAQARAELNAQKEAEEKEKKKAKNERRKARKNVAKESNNEELLVSRSENTTAESYLTVTQEPEIKETKTVSERPQNHLVSEKKANTENVPRPPSMRNKKKNKKKMQPWMWAVLLFLVATSMYMVIG